MFVRGETIVYSATDLTTAAACEFALVRTLDERLGRTPAAGATADALGDRIARLGDAHELRELDRLRAAHGGGVVELAKPDTRSIAGLHAAHATTIEALDAKAPVVYQASFFDGRFLGYADFLVRDDATGAYAVWDAKLSRHAKVTALMQVAAYADQLHRAGVQVAPMAHLRLGDGSDSAHRLADLLPVFRERRAHLQATLDTHQADATAVRWLDDRYAACGRCERCRVEVEAHRDVVLVAGVRASQRQRLREAGIDTIDKLAATTCAVEGIPARTLGTLRAQAALQVVQSPPGGGTGPITSEVFDPTPIHALPAPDPGDVFFDFEGDPMWAEGDSADWGLEYLFGVVEPSGTDPRGTFRSFWAHDRAGERAALMAFLAYVQARREHYPAMHVYHYAAYEKTALRRLSGRHGVGEDIVDELLRAGVLVDLYATVRQSVRVSQPSYSIKKLEPLYMGADLRDGEVTTAGDSIVVYHEYTEALERDDRAEAARLLQTIADYNEYDCLSTWRLRDWLLRQARTVHAPAELPLEWAVEGESTALEDLAPLVEGLLAHAGEPGRRTPDEQAVAMVAAAIGYHRRERKPFWWTYFDRLQNPPDEWADTRDAMVSEQVRLVDPWVPKKGNKACHRVIEVRGRVEPGSALAAGKTVRGIYDDCPPGIELLEGAIRAVGRSSTIEKVSVDDDGRDVLLVAERLPDGCQEFSELPMAVCVGAPVATKSIEAAIEEAARTVAAALPALPHQPALDVLRRVPPRVAGGLPAVGEGAGAYVEAITTAVRRLDHSYLAVQGPPGTGKTYVGARVIKALVEDGWRVGVVAQSHAVVENLLQAAIDAGLDATRIAKKRSGGHEVPWRQIQNTHYRTFLDEHVGAGCLLGGTAWDFTNAKHLDRGVLDLLVVDEAGQFALANTVAVSVASDRLLLLGDPQQLPQVSQGTHPEPVDVSALGWLAAGHETLPADRGYFLATTWRMHSALCAPVSRLAYEDRLRSQVEVTDRRHLDGVRPGVHVVPVAHHGNAVQSPQEAAAIVELVDGLTGLDWRAAPAGATRPLGDADVLVVAPYNAQVAMLRRDLTAAGHPAVRVGTVDKFQGQEAPVVIVSMTASTQDDVPRGMDFLLSRNRLNVAISRGQWCAFVVRSQALTGYLPTTPHALAELGAFIGLGDP